MSLSRKLVRLLACSLLPAFAVALPASGASIYIDFDQPTGGPGVPGNSYAAAAPAPGSWNGLLAKDGVYGSATAAGAIIDTAGSALPGVFVDLGGSMQIQPNVNAPLSLGAHRALLGDFFDTSPPAPPPWTLQVRGIGNGTYDVYVYAPAGPALTTSAWSVGTGAAQAELPGSLDAVLNLGVDYDVVQVVVTANAITLNSGSVGGLAGPSGLAGLQLVQVSAIPLPAAGWLFGASLIALFGMRLRPGVAG